MARLFFHVVSSEKIRERSPGLQLGYVTLENKEKEPMMASSSKAVSYAQNGKQRLFRSPIPLCRVLSRLVRERANGSGSQMETSDANFDSSILLKI